MIAGALFVLHLIVFTASRRIPASRPQYLGKVMWELLGTVME